MFLGIFFDVDSTEELTWYFTAFNFVLFWLLIYYVSRIKIMIQYFFEKDGGDVWEKIRKAKDRG